MTQYSVQLPKKVKGILVFDNVQLHLGVYPNAFHRWMQRLCFGFIWKKPNT